MQTTTKPCFGLRENPFNLTPDPRYLHRTRQAHVTLRLLTHGILDRKGLTVLSGPVGTGKTTLLYTALHRMNEEPAVRDKLKTAVIVNPTLTSDELLETVLDEFEVACGSRSKPRRLEALLETLLEVRRSGGTAVLVVDEAQLLNPGLLDEISLLLNLQTSDEKLLQIVLSGQPEIEANLSKIESCDLQRQVSVHCKTAPLTLEETNDYIQHRLRVAGARCIFPQEVADTVYRHSNGIPRLVNLLCADALIGADRDRVEQVSPQMIEEASLKIPPGDIKPLFHLLHSGDTTKAEFTSLRLTANQEKAWINVPAPHAVIRHRPHLNRVSVRSADSVLPWELRLDRWSRNFTRTQCWVFFSEVGLTAALLLTTAEVTTYAAPWPHLARVMCGFLGLILTAVFVGLGAFLLIDKCQTWSRDRIALSTIKYLLKGQIDGKLAPRISHLRE
jgi:general secretion pathway protein A